MSENAEPKVRLFESLLLDDEEIKQEIEIKAGKVLMLDRQGRIVFKIPEQNLKQKEVIGIYLLGQYIAYELDIFDNPSLTTDKLSELTRLDAKTIAARITDLKKQNAVETPERGVYQITLLGANNLLDEILEK